MDRTPFFTSEMLRFVALAQRPEVAERLSVSLAKATDVDSSIQKFYVKVLTDLLSIAKDKKVIATTKKVIKYWETGEGEPEQLCRDAFAASNTGGVVLGPDQRALDLIVARAAARTFGIPSPDHPQHFSKGDGVAESLGNVAQLVMLGMAKDPSREDADAILPPTHTERKNLNVGTFTKYRAMRASELAIAYIDTFISCL